MELAACQARSMLYMLYKSEHYLAKLQIVFAFVQHSLTLFWHHTSGSFQLLAFVCASCLLIKNRPTFSLESLQVGVICL